MVDQVNVTDTEETVFEKVQINDAVHGTFNIEVPQGMSDSDILNELDNLDLDLLLGIGNIDEDIGETNVEKIKEFENSSGAGLRDNKWYGHDSLEGGTQTIAYGHKLTAEEAKQGFIEINGEQVDYRKGLTQEQAEAVLNKDAKWAETHAVASLKKVGLDGDEGKVEALTSLIYNVGSGAWGGSNAKAYLEAGQVEDFMHEAFSEEEGFVKVNGKTLRGLVRRRAAEAQLFASANIDEGGGFATMMQDVLAAINPISSAAAAEVTPQTPLDAKVDVDVDAINEELSKFKEGAEGFKGTISGRILAEIGKALMLPGNVATGRMEPTVENTFNAASAMTGGSVATSAPKGALRSGLARSKGKTREEVNIQGGPLNTKLDEDKIVRVLDDHSINWEYAENGGITAFSEGVTKTGKPITERKHFAPNTSLKTIRDWLGYGVAGAAVVGANEAEASEMPTLKRNSTDTEAVGRLQDMLGMDVGEDRGIFGPATEAAVKAFQKEQGLTVDGIAGKNTFDALQGSKPQKSSMLSKLNPIGSAQASEAQAAIPPLPTPKNATPEAQGFWDIVTSTPAIAGLIDVVFHQNVPGFLRDEWTIGDTVLKEKTPVIYTENMLSKGALDFLKSEASSSISKGKLNLDYNIDKEGVASVGHKADLPDLRKPTNELKFFIGKGDYVRIGNDAYLADEYDYDYKLELRDQSTWSKLSDVYARYEEYEKGKIGKMGVLDSVLERYQSKPGEGPSVRIKIGSKEELKISQEAFNKLPTLEEYEKKKTGKMLEVNRGWRPNS